jgi:hypothetical protein
VIVSLLFPSSILSNNVFRIRSPSVPQLQGSVNSQRSDLSFHLSHLRLQLNQPPLLDCSLVWHLVRCDNFTPFVSHHCKSQHFLDRVVIREEHQQAIQAYTAPTRRRHPILQRPDEVLIYTLHLIVSVRLLPCLLFKTTSLFGRIVELGEQVVDLSTADESF